MFRPTGDEFAGQVIVQNAGAALQPGDIIRQRLTAADGAVVDVVGQGAMPVTGRPGRPPAREETELNAVTGSTLVHRPEPRLLLPNANFRQHINVSVAVGSIAILVDAVVIHPDGDDGTFGSCTSTVVISVPGETAPRAVDAQSLAALPRTAGLRAFGTLFVVTPDPTDGRVGEELTRLEHDAPAYLAATSLPGAAGWAVRIAAPDGQLLRTGLAQALNTSRRSLGAQQDFRGSACCRGRRDHEGQEGEGRGDPGQRTGVADEFQGPAA
ncbi:urease accessory protein UreD [Saccharopolyspora sp. K220]|uniref:urease accessory protein UreD n=1 Tax=Saccharopolyspora soli TaxID=2926618 RepID=UPI001F5A9790|nr:urease accessory protein UreD [Saccharopolyspora soli]MCI2421686.1 urease accessory protein UreD [Saccharopolyspora soli]